MTTSRIATTRFQRPTRAAPPRNPGQYQPGGMNMFSPPWALDDESPYVENMQYIDGCLRPRRPLQADATGDIVETFTIPPKGIGEFYVAHSNTTATDGGQGAPVGEGVIFQSGHTAHAVWYDQVQAKNNATAVSIARPSLPVSESDEPVSWTLVFDPVASDTSRYIAVGTDYVGLPYIVTAEWAPLGSAAALAQSVFMSADSYAKHSAAIDERLVFFNSMSSVSLSHPTRVHWSVRANPTDFDVATGGGYQDLLEIGAEGTGLVAERDRLILLSPTETWEGRPRRDNFAFDFLPISRVDGTKFGRTAASTPIGTIYLADDLSFRLVVGSEVVQIGERIKPFLRSTMSVDSGAVNITEKDFLHAAYEPTDQTYSLYFADNSATTLPNRSVSLSIAELRRGREVWSSNAFPFKVFGAAKGYMGLLDNASSIATIARHYAQPITDTLDWTEPSPIAVWTLPALVQRDPSAYEAGAALWIDYSADEAGTFDVRRYDQGGSIRTLGGYTSMSSRSYQASDFSTAYIPIEAHAQRHDMLQIRIDDGTRPCLLHARVDFRAQTGRH